MEKSIRLSKTKIISNQSMTAILTSSEVIRLPLHRSEAALLCFRRIGLVGGTIWGSSNVLFGTKSGYLRQTERTIQTSHSTVSQYSSLSYGNEILWSLSYFSQRYSCMLAPSKTRLGLPEVWSTRAGMRPLAGEDHQSVKMDIMSKYPFAWDGRGVRMVSEQSTYPGLGGIIGLDWFSSTWYVRLISRNQGSFCWFLLNSSLCTLYCRPSSSRVMEILWPLGAVR
jgi:hypothetical protein